jgi:hypothetical protein
MRLFTVEDRADLFAKIGKAVIGIQDEYSGGTTPHEVVPELVNTLLLLAAFISRDNLDGKVADFVFRCAEVAGQVWGDDEIRKISTPCLSALASGDACQPDELKRCAICGFVGKAD